MRCFLLCLVAVAACADVHTEPDPIEPFATVPALPTEPVPEPEDPPEPESEPNVVNEVCSSADIGQFQVLDALPEDTARLIHIPFLRENVKDYNWVCFGEPLSEPVRTVIPSGEDPPAILKIAPDIFLEVTPDNSLRQSVFRFYVSSTNEQYPYLDGVWFEWFRDAVTYKHGPLFFGFSEDGSQFEDFSRQIAPISSGGIENRGEGFSIWGIEQ